MATTTPESSQKPRASGTARHLLAGGSLRAIDIPSILGGPEGDSLRLHLAWGHLTVLEPKGPPGPEHGRQSTPTNTPALEAATRILQRGSAPPLHPSTERRLLESVGLEVDTENPARLDMTPTLTSATEPPDREQLLAAVAWSRRSTRSRSIRVPAATRQMARLIYGPAAAARMGLALIEVLSHRQLDPTEEWTLEIEESLPVASFALPAALELLAAVGGLFNESLIPQRVWLTTGERTLLYRVQSAGQVSRAVVDSRSLRPHLKIFLEPEQDAEATVPEAEDCPVVVIRRGQSELGEQSASRPTAETGSVLRTERSDLGLRWIAQTLFARRELGAEQLDATYRLLAGKDCAVNLAAGRGRSSIYQLTALIQPGRSLIVEPDDTFIKQQKTLLAAHGIDRIGELLPAPPEDPQTDDDSLFVFSTPVALRSGRVRDRLARYHSQQPFDTIVFDRAECVSEWSVSLAPALAGLRGTLQALLATDRQLKVLALAAAEVHEHLRDVLAEVSDRRDPEVLIEARAASGRSFTKIIRSNPRRAIDTLSTHLASLPKKFGMPSARFFANSREGRQGVVLCSRAEGPFGLVATRGAAQQATPEGRVGIFATEIPSDLEGTDFSTARERDLEDFIAGKLSVLVTTNDLWPLAAGACLDYVVHFGLPASAAFLREAAHRLTGRGGKEIPVVIHLAQSEKRVSSLTRSDVDLARLREDLAADEEMLDEPEDLLRHLHSHADWFLGPDAEMKQLLAILERPDFDPAAAEIAIPPNPEALPPDRALFRLQSLGVLRDWAVSEDGTLMLYPGNPTSGDAESIFWQRALRLLPARVGMAGLDSVDAHEPSSTESIHRRLETTLQLVYRAVEPHRRQQVGDLQVLSKRAGRREIPSPAEPLAGRLTPQLEAAAVAGRHGVRSWITCLSDVLPQQLRELERTVEAIEARSPTAPGVHLARGIACLLDGSDDRGFERALTGTFLGMHVEGGEAWDSLQAVFSWLMPRVKAWQPSWSVDLWTAWEEAEAAIEARRKPRQWPSHILRETEIHSLTEPSQTPDEAVVVLERRLREACSILDALKEHFWMEEAEL